MVLSLSRLTACASVVALVAVSASAAAADSSASFRIHKVTVAVDGTKCADNVVYAVNDAGEYGGIYYCHGAAEGFLIEAGHNGARAVFNAPGGKHTATIVTGLASNGDAAVTTHRHGLTPVRAYIRPHAGGDWRHLRDPHAGSAGTAINGVNSAGRAVGFYYTGGAGSPEQAYQEIHRHYADFVVDEPGMVSSYLSGINDKGEMVGGWTDSEGVGHAFVARHDKLTELHVPGAGKEPGDGVYVTSVASNGAYAGDVVKNGQQTGFVVHDGRRSTPAASKLRSDSSAVRAVNRHGTVVGDYLGANGVSHGFLAKRS